MASQLHIHAFFYKNTRSSQKAIKTALAVCSMIITIQREFEGEQTRERERELELLGKKIYTYKRRNISTYLRKRRDVLPRYTGPKLNKQPVTTQRRTLSNAWPAITNKWSCFQEAAVKKDMLSSFQLRSRPQIFADYENIFFSCTTAQFVNVIN